MFIRREIHARDLVAGRGNVAEKILGKKLRAKIFFGLLELIAAMPNVRLFNVCLDSHGKKETEAKAWGRLLNRIDRTTLEYENKELPLRKKLIHEIPNGFSADALTKLEQRLLTYHPRAMIFADHGSEVEITRIFRKMRVFNPTPSKYGAWSSGQTKSIPLEKIIEDPTFRKSERSHFIQLADCVAFALLKREASPTKNIAAQGIYKFFEECLAGICHKPACPSDPLGIVRK